MIWHNGIMIDRKRMAITHNFNTIRPDPREATNSFTAGGYQFRVLERLILQPSSTQELFDFIFDVCPDGGPIVGRHLFLVRFAQWRPMLKKAQLDLVSNKRSGTVYYEIVPNVV